MWYLEKPSEKDLNAYKALLYDKIQKKIEKKIEKDSCFKILLEEDNIEKLLISEPKELYELNKDLMKKRLGTIRGKGIIERMRGK